MFCEALHLCVVGFCRHAGFMRMQSCAGKDPVMLFSNLQRAVVCARASTTADGKNALQSSLAGACQHLGAVRIEFVAFNVSVGIDVQSGPSLFINITHY